MGKPTICLGENKGADQLRSNCEADQRLCFCYSDSTVPLLLKSEISRFWLFSVTVQVGLCPTWSATTLLVFPRGGLYFDVRVYVCLYTNTQHSGGRFPNLDSTTEPQRFLIVVQNNVSLCLKNHKQIICCNDKIFPKKHTKT